MAARKPFFIFTVLALYIVLQFGWWVYLLYQQGIVIHELEAGRIAPDHRSYSLSMVIGEGSVFLIIVLTGLYMAYRAYCKELRLVRTKDNFLMAVTHELRTPIAGMRLNLQTLQRIDLNDDQRSTLMQRAISDTARLQALSDRILLAAQSDDDIVRSTSSTVDVSLIVTSSCENARQTFANEHKLLIDIEPDINLFIDQAAMTSIIENLVQNAANYSPKGSAINVKLNRDKNKVMLEVADQGFGITDKEKQLIFEKFYRSGDEKTRSTKGTGLGLHIVKRLSEQYNGVVQLKDNEPQGSIFVVQFPANTE